MASDDSGVDATAVIAQSPWFSELPDIAHERLADNARVRSYEKGSYLFTAGECTADIFCILSGRIRLLLTSELGQEYAITDLNPGAWLNEVALVNDLPRIFDALVNEQATVLQIACTVANEVGNDFPHLYRLVFADHVLRTRGFYTLMQGMAFYPLRSRLAGWLLQLSEDHGSQTDRGVAVDINLNQNDLAQLSHGSRQRINKILNEWGRGGIIETTPGGYLITDMDRLLAETELKES